MIDWVSIVRASRRRFSYRGRPGQRREKRRRKLMPQYYDDDACCICCFAGAPDKECEVGPAVLQWPVEGTPPPGRVLCHVFF